MRLPQHMILWRNSHFFLSIFKSTPDFRPPFLLNVRCNSGVTFERGCFRDGDGASSVDYYVNATMQSVAMFLQ